MRGMSARLLTLIILALAVIYVGYAAAADAPLGHSLLRLRGGRKGVSAKHTSSELKAKEVGPPPTPSSKLCEPDRFERGATRTWAVFCWGKSSLAVPPLLCASRRFLPRACVDRGMNEAATRGLIIAFP